MIPYLLFLLSLAAIPISGFLLFRGLFGRLQRFSALERLVFSFALGLGSLDLSLIVADRIGFALTTPVIIAAFALVPSLAFLTRLSAEAIARPRRTDGIATVDRPRFSPREFLLFAIVLALTVFLKTLFLSTAGLPTATDLGHHMYWSKLITETGRIPEYAKISIGDAGNGRVALSDPLPISDFIVGEHLPFAAIAKLSGASFLSAFPVSFLLLVNILSVVAIFLFATRAAEHLQLPDGISPIAVGLATLLFAGPLFAIASPEAKFVSGGVVGNLIGDLFIPLALLAFLISYAESDAYAFALGVLLSFMLAYTHHLSVLVLAIVVFGAALLIMLRSARRPADLLVRLRALFVSIPALIVIVFVASFFLFVAKPTYIETQAVGTAVGEATKATRMGLSFDQVAASSGMSRVAIGIACLGVLLLARGRSRSDAFPFLVGWAGIMLLITMKPGWVMLNIPSDRIGNYLVFPFSVLAGLFMATFPAMMRSNRAGSTVPGQMFLFASLVLFTFSVWDGAYDNQKSLPTAGKAQDALQTFAAAEYLAARELPDDVLLKDHNYLAADSWMKIFFMRDYAYPLSRAYFKRYEDETNPREQCTLRMISVPNLPEGEACYKQLGVNLVVVNPTYDREQFERSDRFSRIYSDNSVHVYERSR